MAKAMSEYYTSELSTMKSALLGSQVLGVDIGMWAVAIQFQTSKLMIEYDWNLRDQQLVSIDDRVLFKDRNSYNLWRICGSTVTGLNVTDVAPITVSIQFDCGWSLEVYSRLNGLESWTLTADDSSLVIVCDGAL